MALELDEVGTCELTLVTETLELLLGGMVVEELGPLVNADVVDCSAVLDIEVPLLVVLVIAARLVEVIGELLAGSDTLVGLLRVVCRLEDARLEEASDTEVEDPLSTVELLRAALAASDELDDGGYDNVVADVASEDGTVAIEGVLGESICAVLERATPEVAAELGLVTDCPGELGPGVRIDSRDVDVVIRDPAWGQREDTKPVVVKLNETGD